MEPLEREILSLVLGRLAIMQQAKREGREVDAKLLAECVRLIKLARGEGDMRDAHWLLFERGPHPETINPGLDKGPTTG